ncbi:hypothetical protein N0O92_18070 [Alkalihalobacillus sp. MEB130]|nr:hypothetical protein [Alkalihalobacillus sp. MEB130]MDT8862121.1 hypothetical protein [Alkalihalobacillus sp. MEB130]
MAGAAAGIRPITFDLDSEQLDEASSVKRYRFKDVEVQMNGLESQIEI